MLSLDSFSAASHSPYEACSEQSPSAFLSRSHITATDSRVSIVLSDSQREIARIIASSPEIPSLIYGETGTGKEEYAKFIHFLRMQSDKGIPFVAVNCANLKGDLASSALFGHKKGSFTGASQDAAGCIAMANGGILFLDEVHTLDPSTQQKLLRVLNDGTYQRIGCDRNQRSQFQLICASTKDLDDLADQGEFLIDLRMRLMGFEVKLPALRDRLGEMPALIRCFFEREGLEPKESLIQELSDSCASFYWQGNIRQLFRCLKVLLAYCKGNLAEMKPSRLPVYKTMYRPDAASSEGLGQGDTAAVLYPLSHDMDLEEALSNYERTVIHHALKRHHSVNEVVKVLGISRSTFALKRRKYGLIENSMTDDVRLQKKQAQDQSGAQSLLN